MRRSTPSVELNLLPFQGVLCAVIGILMLLLVAALTTRAVGLQGTGGKEAVPAGQDQTDGIDETQYAALETRLRSLIAEFNRQGEELTRLRHAATQLRNLLQIRNDAQALGLTDPDDIYPGLRLRQPTDVRVVPAPGQGDKRTPIPLEVTDRGCVIHVQPSAIVVDDLPGKEPVLRRFLEQVAKKHDRQYLLILVRPNGVETYHWLREYLRQRFSTDALFAGRPVRKTQFDLGVEPFDGDWLLVVPQQDP